MYVIGIDSLKSDLREERVSQIDAFWYLFATLFVPLLASYLGALLPSEALDFWGHVNHFLYLLIFSVGMFFAFQANGGATGKDFLLRFTALGWVLLIRFIPLLFVVAFLHVLLIGSLPVIQEAAKLGTEVENMPTTWRDIVPYAIWLLWYYVRVVKHVGDVAREAT